MKSVTVTELKTHLSALDMQRALDDVRGDQ
jgi:hypothetical protein